MTECQPATWTLTARWVFPVDEPPLENGQITIAGDRIIAVEPTGSRKPTEDLGDVAILPGFVNTHTHLDLTGMRGQVAPGPDFVPWLREVIAYRRQCSPDQVEADIRAGLAESLAHGTTLIGDIAAQGISWSILVNAPIRSVVFFELLGLSRQRAHQTWAAALAWLDAHRSTRTCRSGLSPHAPYSVRAALFRAAAAHSVARLAAGTPLPLAIHLAETTAEMELLQHRRGALVDLLSERGVWDPEGLVDSPQQVLAINRDVWPSLMIHGNYLDAAMVHPTGSSIIYCPRTHAAFGHARHTVCELLAAGVRVALGTDSLASNPDLSVLAEARFLHQKYPDIPGEHVLRMATLSGAEALGWQTETGSLKPGKSADLIVLPLPPGNPRDPHLRILESDTRVARVMSRGRWLQDLEILGETSY